MEEARKTTIAVTCEGNRLNNITSFSYTDNAEGEADNINISLHCRNVKERDRLLMLRNKTAEAIINSDGRKLKCGSFLLDNPSGGYPPYTVTLNGSAKPVNSNFADCEKSASFEKITLMELFVKICRENRLLLVYDTKINPYINFKCQEQKSDCEFLSELTQLFGLTIKLYSNKVIVYCCYEYQKRTSVTVLHSNDIISLSFDINEADTNYTACEVSYTDENGILHSYTYTIKGRTGSKTLKLEQSFENISQAILIAKGELYRKNIAEISLGISLKGDTSLYATNCVYISDQGVLSGKYFITSSAHNVGSGYTTDLTLQRVVAL